MGMNPGKLRERLTLQSSSGSGDGQGGRTVGWADVAPAVKVWARVTPLSTHERIQSMQTDAPASHEVEIRYRTDVTAKSRWKWVSGGVTRYLRVVAAPTNPDEHRAMLAMLCAEDRG